MSIRIANAPVTWGIWGANSLPEGRTPAHVLDAVATAGYDGIELGPLGFFGGVDEIANTLGAHDLAVAGMYVPLRVFGSDAILESDIAAVADIARVVAAAGNQGPVVIAEETIAEIKRNVARGRGHALDLDDDGWRRLADAVNRAHAIVEEAGVRATFHPHTGTHIEQPWETDRLLELTRIGLTLDTGHAAAGGDDPRELLRRWSDRVDHIHLKDLSLAPVAAAQRDGTEFGMADASVALGAGDLDLHGFVDDLVKSAYGGWIVVEQDRRPDSGHDHGEVDAEQAANHAWLRSRITTAHNNISSPHSNTN